MKVAACLIAKDEGPYLLEWLSYHLVIGFDELHVYDNHSSDDSARILAHASNADSRIRYQFWPDVPGYSPQLSAYQDALHHIDADWIAFIDTDEFIVLKSVSTIHEYLDTFPAEVTAVSINWRNFASSHQSTRSEGLVLERFLLCPPKDFYRNEVVKSIVRPQHVEAMTAHVPYLKSGLHWRADRSPFPSPGRNRVRPVLHDPAQINHYVIKSREEYEAKWRRGGATYAPEDRRRQEKFGPDHWRTYDVNDELDASAIPLVPTVKRVVQKLSLGRPEITPREDPGDGAAHESDGPHHVNNGHGMREARFRDQDVHLRFRVIAGHHRFVTVRLTFQAAQQRARALDERERLLEARRDAQRLRSQLSAQEREICELEQARLDLLARAQEQAALVEALTQRCAVSERALSEVRASTSWRATAPFRWGSIRIRRIARATSSLFGAEGLSA